MLDVFEGSSRPRPLIAALEWIAVVIAGAMTFTAYRRSGLASDMWIFLILCVVLLMIAVAETHGIMMVRCGDAPRRVIVTSDGVELINPHRRAGVRSVGWENLARISIEPHARGGTRIEVFSHLAEKPSKPMIKAVTASDAVSADDVQQRIDALRHDPT